MSKTKLIEDLRAQHGFKTSDAEIAVEAVFGSLKRVVESGSPVRVPDLGTFKMKHTPERQGRNPATGESIRIAARDQVSFKAAK